LIATTSSDNSSGIPLLMDIPYLGKLFRVDSVNETRTMLMMLIVPYIIENDQDAREITEAMKGLLPTEENGGIRR
jgi:general secretion pathway protein D